MSYCVNCGVKLADYHEKCPLCNTRVLNPNAKIDPQTRDFPKYREHIKSSEPAHMRQMLAGTIISFASTIYIVVLLMINYLVNKEISWSMIPILALVYLWFAIGFPLLRPGQPFFRLYSYDSFATAAFLVALNLVISGDVAWAKFAAPAIIFVWAIMVGIFISDRIKRWVPMIIYFIIASILFAALYAFMLTNSDVIVNLILPLYVAVLIMCLLSFFIIKAMIFDIFKFLAVIFINVGILAVVIDMILTHYLTGVVSPTWSLLVLTALIPLGLVGLLMRYFRTVRSFIARKFHI
jgi:hypothetical protein